MKFTRVLGLGALVCLLASNAMAQPLQRPQMRCDRGCLLSAVDTYFAALVAQDPTRLPWANSPVFVENTERKRPGQGLWTTASAPPDRFRIYVPDEVSQQVGFIGVMREAGQPILIALRLQLDGQRRIAEAEHLIARNLREEFLANLVTPRPAFSMPIPVSQRVSREAMLEIAYSYYVALEGDTGSASPLASDCVRHENGMRTAGPVVNPGGNPASGAPAVASDLPDMSAFSTLGCKGQLDTQIMSYIDSIDNRRVEIADPETGLVFGLSHFRHSMEKSVFNIVGMPGIDRWEFDYDPFDLPAAHIYKISGGMIHEIEAMGFMAPYNSPTGWR